MDYLTDNTTPLKYSAFLAAASGNHQMAMQNAVNALYATSGSYRRVLDLEGARITLASPVVFPQNAGGAVRAIHNGEVKADPSFSGNYLFTHVGNMNSTNLKLIAITFEGNGVASWLSWNDGNMFFFHCHLRNPKKHAVAGQQSQYPGLNDTGTASAGLWMDMCWMTCSDMANTAASQRTQVAIYSSAGDQKIFNTTAAYFRHTLIYDSAALMMDGCHFFQGTPGTTMNDHTACIKIQSGYSGSIINNFYLGKSFIELNLEASSARERRIGGLTLNGCRAYAESSQSNFAFIVARARTTDANDTIKVEDVTISQTIFMNRGTNAVEVLPTRLYNPAKFNPRKYLGIMMRGNGFDGALRPQANPCSVVQDVDIAVPGHGNGDFVDFTGLFPFAGSLNEVVSFTTVKTGGAAAFDANVVLGAINRAKDTAQFDCGGTEQWLGRILATGTCNLLTDTGYPLIDG